MRARCSTPARASAEDKLTFAEATVRSATPTRASGRSRRRRRRHPAGRGGAAQAARRSRGAGRRRRWRAAKLLEKERGAPALHDARLAIDCADAWRRAGDPRKAGDLLRAALFGDPLHANLGLGRVQMASQQPAEAEQSFRAALAAWDKGAYGIDDQTDARVGLARALLAHDPKNKEAASVLDAAVRDDGGSAEARYWLAKVSADQGDHDKARAQADKAIELDDAYAEALALDGDLWRAADKAKAKKAYKKYLEVAPSGSDAKAIRRALSQLK